MIRFTKHAQEAIEERALAVEWIEAAILSPDEVQADPYRPGVTRSYKAVAERGGRMLRVAHRPEGDDILVITVHFDRRARR